MEFSPAVIVCSSDVDSTKTKPIAELSAADNNVTMNSPGDLVLDPESVFGVKPVANMSGIKKKPLHFHKKTFWVKLVWVVAVFYAESVCFLIDYISVIKMHFGTNLPAGRFGGCTAHAPAILQDGGAQGEDGRTDTGTPAFLVGTSVENLRIFFLHLWVLLRMEERKESGRSREQEERSREREERSREREERSREREERSREREERSREREEQRAGGGSREREERSREREERSREREEQRAEEEGNREQEGSRETERGRSREEYLSNLLLEALGRKGYGNMREKSVLVEDVTQLKKLADVSVQDLTHKEEEQKSILHQLHSTIHNVKEKDRDLRLLQTQEQVKQQESVEAQLSEKRSECLSLRSAVHHLEEQYLSTAQSVQERIVSELRKEAEKLRTQLTERRLTADEDKYLRDKMMEDSARLTKGNGHLQSRVLEAKKQLEEHGNQGKHRVTKRGPALSYPMFTLVTSEDIAGSGSNTDITSVTQQSNSELYTERQLREQESLNRAKRISEISSGKENERHLELTLSHWRRLLEDEKEKVASAQEQLQKDRKSVEMTGSSLHKQLTDLQNKHAKVQQENALLRVEKSHLGEHISQLHKQVRAQSMQTPYSLDSQRVWGAVWPVMGDPSEKEYEDRSEVSDKTRISCMSLPESQNTWDFLT
ncbi:unnamed protein product [Ranitomeya imitator]|uniref:Uncharacterized protein n=1 Tax=Ranitomeya imitator TaxID=111125 RepID=A0ABN9KPV2_9NEOB|nr:unnamed protein product [Ranitomeya imitator]